MDVRVSLEVFYVWIVGHMAGQSTANGYHGGCVSADEDGRLFLVPCWRSRMFDICIGDDVAQSISTAVMESW